jgi:hypothetical protein
MAAGLLLLKLEEEVPMNARLLSIVFFGVSLLQQTAHANVSTQNPDKIDHCYQWLKEKDDNRGYLTAKYKFADQNNGEFLFTGQTKAKVVYCAKTPAGSYIYGDRVIRIDLASDVVIRDNINNVCTVSGQEQDASKCANPDLILYNRGSAGSEWYMITNPDVIISWSANSTQLVDELKISNQDGLPDKNYIETITEMTDEVKTLQNGAQEKIYINKKTSRKK